MARALPSWPTRRLTIWISSSMLSGTGSTTVLKRRLSALESSLTPLSRSLAEGDDVEAPDRADFLVEFGDQEGSRTE